MYKNHKDIDLKKNKTERIYIRVTEDEKDRIHKNAQSDGITVSKYMRNTLLQGKAQGRVKHDVCKTVFIQQLYNDVLAECDGCKTIEEFREKLGERSKRLWENLS